MPPRPSSGKAQRPRRGALRPCLIPLIAETTGAWEPEAAKVLTHISRAVATREGADPATLHGELLQELCVVARSFRARAVLHRRAELAAAPAPGTAQSAAVCLLAA